MGSPLRREVLPAGALWAGGMSDPLAAVPARRPGSVRRTMHVDVGSRAEFGAALSLVGAARDLRTGPDGGTDVTVLAEASVAAGFDEGRRLVTLVTSPVARWTADLVGARAGGGFRRLLDSAGPPDDRSSLLRQVLDDLPAGALISGYAWMRLARRAGSHPAELRPIGALDRMTDLCAGWRREGICVDSVRAGRGVPVQETPPAPNLGADDPLAWHELGPLPPDSMRRRRLIDAEAGPDDRFRVWAMFRDTVGEADAATTETAGAGTTTTTGGTTADGRIGGEVVLHEYAVRVEGVGRRITSIEAEPRVLPFPECPGAADAARDLCGLDIGSLAESVPEVLVGVASCTHLNDLFRSLAGVTTLLDALGD